MTWSIITFDKASGAFAVAVATKNLAVGSTVPHLRAGVGAVATQSIANRYLGPACGRSSWPRRGLDGRELRDVVRPCGGRGGERGRQHAGE
jgi:uncharacterized Ntn-hydrolase superfamily protein